MYPTHPLRNDLEIGIRNATDLAALRTGIMNALESLMYDVRDHAGRIDALNKMSSQVDRNAQELGRLARTIRTLEARVAELEATVRNLNS